MKTMSYCDQCQKENNYKIINNIDYEIEYENKLIHYIGKKAICECCGNELFNEEVEAFNQKAFENAYIEKFDIISTNQIDEIIKKYNIGKRPLSLLLGWGETTISRYYQHYIPSVKKSQILKTILKNPNEYYEYLITNKERISKVAYKKSKAKLDLILNIKDENTSIEDEIISKVAKYIINKVEITPMGLQKLLYYIQVIYSYFFQKAIFISKCSAWEHGPVFGKIYYEYKQYGHNQITNETIEEIKLEENLKRVVDAVIKFFGCYSAKTLEFFTHNEDPWLNVENKKNKIIEKSEMKKFGEKLVKENNVSSIEEIYKYSSKMHEKYLNYIKKNN